VKRFRKEGQKSLNISLALVSSSPQIEDVQVEVKEVSRENTEV
jgi:hypothetical protein